MWYTECKQKTKASPEAIWSLWSDLGSWPKWDHGLDWVKASGPFAAGTKGVLKPKGGPAVRYVILESSGPFRFLDRSFLPFTRLDFIHEITVENGSTWVKHRAEMRGLLTPLFRRVIGAGIEKDLPETVARLAAMAEGRS